MLSLTPTQHIACWIRVILHQGTTNEGIQLADQMYCLPWKAFEQDSRSMHACKHLQIMKQIKSNKYSIPPAFIQCPHRAVFGQCSCAESIPLQSCFQHLQSISTERLRLCASCGCICTSSEWYGLGEEMRSFHMQAPWTETHCRKVLTSKAPAQLSLTQDTKQIFVTLHVLKSRPPLRGGFKRKRDNRCVAHCGCQRYENHVLPDAINVAFPVDSEAAIMATRWFSVLDMSYDHYTPVVAFEHSGICSDGHFLDALSRPRVLRQIASHLSVCVPLMKPVATEPERLHELAKLEKLLLTPHTRVKHVVSNSGRGFGEFSLAGSGLTLDCLDMLLWICNTASFVCTHPEIAAYACAVVSSLLICCKRSPQLLAGFDVDDCEVFELALVGRLHLHTLVATRQSFLLAQFLILRWAKHEFENRVGPWSSFALNVSKVCLRKPEGAASIIQPTLLLCMGEAFNLMPGFPAIDSTSHGLGITPRLAESAQAPDLVRTSFLDQEISDYCYSKVFFERKSTMTACCAPAVRVTTNLEVAFQMHCQMLKRLLSMHSIPRRQPPKEKAAASTGCDVTSLATKCVFDAEHPNWTVAQEFACFKSKPGCDIPRSVGAALGGVYNADDTVDLESRWITLKREFYPSFVLLQ